MDPIDVALFEEYRSLGLSQGGNVFERAFAEGAFLRGEELAELVDSTAPK
jgi:hypothetical protein